MEVILQEWENFARKNQPASGDMNIEELRDHAAAMLRTIAADIAVPQSERQRDLKAQGEAQDKLTTTAAELHGDDRLLSGFSVELLVAEYRALRSSVLTLWLAQYPTPSEELARDLIRFNEAIDQALAESTERYSRSTARDRDIFLGIMTHDLRAPLHFLGLAAETLKATPEVDARLMKLGTHMHTCVLRMKGMLDNLIDLTQTRIGNGLYVNVAATDLAAVAEQVVEEFRGSHPDREICLQSTGDCTGTWDAGRIAQVLQNLIGNALQHGSTGSAVSVECHSNDTDAVFTVHNHGKAIGENDQQHIFEFMRRLDNVKPNPTKSMGLGLYIAREIVVSHHGTIKVVSSDAEGTFFSVSLPR